MEDCTMFDLKLIQFLGRDALIIIQNLNGPCPLLAIFNVLMLQRKISISLDRRVIELSEVIQIVANIVLERENGGITSGSPSSSENYAQHVDSIFAILPKLSRGLDLNVFFSNISKFEFTEEISIFDSLRVPLFHGWIADEEDSALLKGMSYNLLVFKVVDYKSLCDKINHRATKVRLQQQQQQLLNNADNLAVGALDHLELTEQEQELLSNGPALEHFLVRTAGQLTNAGIRALYHCLQDRQSAVFFRNNHFSAIFSFNGTLFSLVTDQGYVDEPTVVWESISETSGNSEYYNSDFVPLYELHRGTGGGDGSVISAASSSSFVGVGVGAGSSGSARGGTICAPPAAQSTSSLTPWTPPTTTSRPTPPSVSGTTPTLQGGMSPLHVSQQQQQQGNTGDCSSTPRALTPIRTSSKYGQNYMLQHDQASSQQAAAFASFAAPKEQSSVSSRNGSCSNANNNKPGETPQQQSIDALFPSTDDITISTISVSVVREDESGIGHVVAVPISQVALLSDPTTNDHRNTNDSHQQSMPTKIDATPAVSADVGGVDDGDAPGITFTLEDEAAFGETYLPSLAQQLPPPPQEQQALLQDDSVFFVSAIEGQRNETEMEHLNHTPARALNVTIASEAAAVGTSTTTSAVVIHPSATRAAGAIFTSISTSSAGGGENASGIGSGSSSDNHAVVVDSDMLLAMDLQRREGNGGNMSGYSINGDIYGGGEGGGLNFSAEEMNHQHALMLQFQQEREDREERAAAAAVAGSKGTVSGGRRSQQQQQKPNACVCM